MSPSGRVTVFRFLSFRVFWGTACCFLTITPSSPYLAPKRACGGGVHHDPVLGLGGSSMTMPGVALAGRIGWVGFFDLTNHYRARENELSSLLAVCLTGNWDSSLARNSSWLCPILRFFLVRVHGTERLAICGTQAFVPIFFGASTIRFGTFSQ